MFSKNRIFTAVRNALAVLCLVGSASAAEIVLNLDGAPLTLPRGDRKTQRIVGIPANAPGVLRIKAKWHAASLIPNTFNKLTLRLLHVRNNQREFDHLKPE